METVKEQERHPLLEAFKLRMRIFHDVEDDNLGRLLRSSESAIRRLCGVADEELILERARYAYNDKLELFYRNFRHEVSVLNLDRYEPEDDEDVEKEGADGENHD